MSRFLTTRTGRFSLPAIVPVHNWGAGGNTPEYWRYPGLPTAALFNAYFLIHRKRPPEPLHRRFGRLHAFVDSGGYLFTHDPRRQLAGAHRRTAVQTNGGTPSTLPDPEPVLRLQERLRADVAFTLDYPLEREHHYAPQRFSKVIRWRAEVSAANAASAYALRRDRRMLLFPVVHGPTPRHLRRFLLRLAHHLRNFCNIDVGDVDGFAIGSLVPISRDLVRVATLIRSLRQMIPEDKPLHIFGVTGPYTLPLLVWAGADTMDAKTFIIAAAKRLYYLPLSAQQQGLRPFSRLPIAYLQPRYHPADLCSCPICQNVEGFHILRTRIKLATLHNLYVLQERLQQSVELAERGELTEWLLKQRGFRTAVRKASAS